MAVASQRLDVGRRGDRLVDEVRQRLVDAGIEVTEKELGVDHTWMVTCRDPNGVYIEFHQYTDDSLQFKGGVCQIDYTP